MNGNWLQIRCKSLLGISLSAALISQISKQILDQLKLHSMNRFFKGTQLNHNQETYTAPRNLKSSPKFPAQSGKTHPSNIIQPSSSDPASCFFMSFHICTAVLQPLGPARLPRATLNVTRSAPLRPSMAERHCWARLVASSPECGGGASAAECGGTVRPSLGEVSGVEQFFWGAKPRMCLT